MKDAQVVRDDGTAGRVVADAEGGRLVVAFATGEHVTVPAEALVPQADGTHRLVHGGHNSTDAAAGERQVVIPVIAEELTVETHRVARGRVRVHKRVETRDEVVETPVVHEEIVIDRVPIDRFVDDDRPEVREEDGVLVIPVLEEVLVVEKRLRLREEVRVSTRRTSTTASQTVTLRREVVDVSREELDGTEAASRQATGGAHIREE